MQAKDMGLDSLGRKGRNSDGTEYDGMSRVETGQENAASTGEEDFSRKTQETVEVNGEVVHSVTPTKAPKGLSFDDYPKDWSRKKIKKEMSAVRIALAASKKKLKPP